MWYQNWAKNGGDLCNLSTKEADRFAQSHPGDLVSKTQDKKYTYKKNQQNNCQYTYFKNWSGSKDAVYYCIYFRTDYKVKWHELKAG